MGAAEVQTVCENGAPVSQAWIQSALCKPPMSTQRNRLGSAYTLSLSHRFILTQEKKSGEKGKKVTSAVCLATHVSCTVLGIFWEQEPLWMENRGGEVSKALLDYWLMQFGRISSANQSPALGPAEALFLYLIGSGCLEQSLIDGKVVANYCTLLAD